MMCGLFRLENLGAEAHYEVFESLRCLRSSAGHRLRV
jgi:hypothetical protein